MPLNQCTWILEGPRLKEGPGRGKVWWRRQCKRRAEMGSDRCWQHRRSD
ncbi:MAG: hypothetical protein K0Q89_26 [Thermomicrobiales bacterium]|jgi:hypothetical protein|nr:hypothetical protein [Thermomicrobiales bacterium]